LFIPEVTTVKTLLRALAIATATVFVTPTLYAGQITLPTTLDTLLPDGDFAMVGDLKFDSFNYIFGGDMPEPVQINVEAVADGIRFTGPFVDLPGGVGNGGSDATLGFTVTGGISQVSLSGNPSLLGGVGTGVAAVTETFAGDPTTKLDIFDQGAGVNLIATTLIPATSSLTVIKDILLLSQDPVESATLSVIEQKFVPEPTTLSMLLLGLGTLGFFRRRR